MDSNALERERGITILSKSTSLRWDDFLINIVDTPGHADFGGEVERALGMVDGVILVVDATEGPMAQTKFVLGKALNRSIIPIVVQNKVDRDTARCEDVDCEILDLFMSLNANAEQLDYQTLYASAREGWAFEHNPFKKLANSAASQPVAITGSMSCLFETIVAKVPPPRVKEDPTFSLLVNSIEHNPYVGRCMLGRVESGKVKVGDQIKSLSPDGSLQEQTRVTRLFIRQGLDTIDLNEAYAGQIISVAGIQQAKVNWTIAAIECDKALPTFPLDPPTLSMTLSVNSSPLAGTEGRGLTKVSLFERLKLECDNNPSLDVRESAEVPDSFVLAGRGEMQLSVLIETIRREGLELAVSPPQVVYHTDPSAGGLLEPVEEVSVDCDDQYSGTVIEGMSKRKGELLRITSTSEGKTRLIFSCPMRGLIGYATELKNNTKGTGLVNHVFYAYQPYKGPIQAARKGALISMSEGLATGYALADLEARGELFIEPGTRVYPGMVIGECSRSLDMEVNPCRAKALTNVRATVKEEFVRLRPPRSMPLEELISYMGGMLALVGTQVSQV